MSLIPIQNPNGGRVHINKPADPAPGVNFQWSPDNNAQGELLAVSFTLTTDANVADRFCALRFYDGSHTVLYSSLNLIQTASLAISYNFFQGCTYSPPAAASPFLFGSLPNNLIFSISWSIHSELISLQVGDQFSDIMIIWNRMISF